MSKHKEAEISALNELEQAEKFEQAVVSTPANTDSIDFEILPGKWYDIKREQLAYEGKYYKDSLRFQVQAASVSTIKYFAAMDETNPMSVKDALFKLISTHVRVLDGNRIVNSLDVLYEVDQMRALLLINLYTGTGNTLKARVQCTGDETKKCNHVQEISIGLQNLEYGVISERIQKYFVSSTGSFTITTKSNQQFAYKPLTLRQQEQIIDYILTNEKDGNEIEKQFNDLAGFYVHRFNDIKTAYTQYINDTNDIKTLSLMLKMINEDLLFRQLPSFVVTCEKCGRLHSEQIVSIDSAKNLFLVSSEDDEY